MPGGFYILFKSNYPDNACRDSAFAAEAFLFSILTSKP